VVFECYKDKRRITSFEHVWKTFEDGVDFIPEHGGKPYPRTHMRADWLDQRCVEVPIPGEDRIRAAWLHIAPVRSIEDMYLYKVVLSYDEPRLISKVHVPEPLIRVLKRSNMVTRSARHVNSALRPLRALMGFDLEQPMEDPDSVNFSFHGGEAYVHQGLVAKATASIGTRAISGLLINTVYDELQRVVAMDASLCYAEQKWTGLANSMVLNSLAVALVQFAPVRFVETVDEFRKNSTAFEEAKARIHRPGAYSGGLATLSLVSGLKWMLAFVVLAAFFVFILPPDPTRGPYSGASKQASMLVPFVARLGFVDRLMIPGVLQMMGTGLFGAVSEEFLRTWSPTTMDVLSGYEFCAYVYLGAPWWLRVPAFLMHSSLGLITRLGGGYDTLAVRLTIHGAFNGASLFVAVWPTNQDFVLDAQEFKEWAFGWSRGLSHTVGEGVFYLNDIGVKRMRSFLPAFVLPKHLTHYINTLVFTVDGRSQDLEEFAPTLEKWCIDDCSCDHIGICLNCRRAADIEFIHPLMVTNGLLYAPRNGNVTLIMALLRRGFADPTDGEFASPRSEREFITRVERNLFHASEWIGDRPLRLDDLPSHCQCAAAMGGAKGRNYMDTHERLEQGVVLMKKRIQEKWNEQLKYGSKGVKPRLITALTTDIQVLTMQVARSLSARAKEYFNGTRCMSIKQIEGCEAGRDHLVRFCIADPKPHKMNEYGRLMQEPIPFVIVSCDDTLASSGGRSFGPFGDGFLETDYTMYDQTQFIPLWRALAEWSIKWKFPVGWIDVVRSSVEQQFSGGKKRPVPMKIRGRMHAQMPTGISITSIVGGLFNITNWTNSVIRGVSIEKSSEMLGLKIKVIASRTLEGTTFLRGWWNRSLSGVFTWANLPSLSLKLGKSFKDPRTICKSPEAAAHLFRAVLESTKNLPDDYPILGAMLRTARRLADQDEALEKLKRDPYIIEGHQHKVFGSSDCSRKGVLHEMWRRYNVTEDEVVHAERLINSVKQLPCFVSHRVFERMRDVDYAA